jgi:hypothetical protein
MEKGWIAIAGLMCCVGCRPPRGPISIHSEDPDLKIHAIHQDVQCDNTKDLSVMVADLDSDDPAIRFYSIQGLRRLTHDDFGYHYYESDDQRAPATRLWQKWLKEHQK